MSSRALTRTGNHSINSRTLCQLSYAGQLELPILGHSLGDGRLPPHFWSKVQPDDNDCWIWTGAVQSRGYGSFLVAGKAASTFRISYEAFVGPIPEGLTIDHLCRVKRCCHPAHLEAVTVAENLRRMQMLKTHCVHGHPFSGDNLRIYMRGSSENRICIACTRRNRRRLSATEQVAA